MNKSCNDKVLYLGESYHGKTGSTVFLQDLLRRHYKLEYFTIQGALKTEIRRIAARDYAAVIFFQIDPSPYINFFNRHNLVFVPMYDSFESPKGRRKLFLVGIKWLFFSEAHRNIGAKRSLFVKYYPEPASDVPRVEDDSFFFWQRRDNPSWNDVKKLISGCKHPRVHIHTAVDPFCTFTRPSKDDIERYSITLSDWFESREEMISLIRKHRYYIAPRAKEGIGMSYLEAMAHGRIVIATDAPTMNEYIGNGVNGYLYNLNDPQPISFGSSDSTMPEKAWETISQGRRSWLVDERRIIDFIQSFCPKRFYPLNIETARVILGAKSDMNRKRIYLYKTIGNHSNRLLQHANLLAYCMDRNIELVDFNEYDIFRPYSHASMLRNLAAIAYKLESYVVRTLAKLGLLSTIDISDLRVPDLLDKELSTKKRCFVAGWGFFVPDLLKKYRERISALFQMDVPATWKTVFEMRLVIGLHVRRVDYATFEGGRYFYSDEQYVSILRHAITALGIDEPQVIIFSNDIEIDMSRYKSIFPHCYLSREEYYVDHALMSKCDFLVGPPSTFTQWASYIGSVPLLAVRNPDMSISKDDFKVFPEI